MSHNEENDENHLRYILFYIGEELYGSPLLSVKEVIKAAEIKAVPHMASYFLGVINLRGQIVSVVDMRKKFGITPRSGASGLILIVETQTGFVGAMIDDLASVHRFEEGEIQRGVYLETKIPTEYFLGVGKSKDRLVNLVDISRCVTSGEMKLVSRSKAA